MLELFFWLADARFGLALLGFAFFADSKFKKRDAEKTFVDRACQTNPAQDWETLEGISENSKHDVGTQAVLGEEKKLSPYVWDHAYWPSEGG